MLTKGDVVDIICEHLSGKKPAAPLSVASRPLGKKIFISDWELKKIYRKGEKSVRVPVNAIVSPLSRDWLDYLGIEVVRG